MRYLIISLLGLFIHQAQSQNLPSELDYNTLSKNRVQKITQYTIDTKTPSKPDTIEIQLIILDEEFRISQVKFVDIKKDSSFIEIFYHNKNGIYRITRIFDNNEQLSRTFDPTSKINCYCPKILDAGHSNEYYPNGLLKFEDYGIAVTYYEYTISSN